MYFSLHSIKLIIINHVAHNQSKRRGSGNEAKRGVEFRHSIMLQAMRPEFGGKQGTEVSQWERTVVPLCSQVTCHMRAKPSN